MNKSIYQVHKLHTDLYYESNHIILFLCLSKQFSMYIVFCLVYYANTMYNYLEFKAKSCTILNHTESLEYIFTINVNVL